MGDFYKEHIELVDQDGNKRNFSVESLFRNFVHRDKEELNIPCKQIPAQQNLIEMANTILRQNEIILQMNSSLMAVLSAPISLCSPDDYKPESK